MAEHWIRVHRSTYGKPPLRRFARRLGISRVMALGLLAYVWLELDDHIRLDEEDGFVDGWTLDDIAAVIGDATLDDEIDIPIEAAIDALMDSGWFVQVDGGIRLTGYARHNSTAQQRLIWSRQKAAQRAKNADSGGCPPDIQRTSSGCPPNVHHKRRGEEKRTEEIDGASAPSKNSEPSGSRVSGGKAKPDLIADPPIADTLLDTDAFREAWAEWHAYRKERKLSRWTNRTVKVQIKELTDAGHDEAIAAIKRSIAQGWAGLFPAGNRAAAGGGGSRPGRNGTTANGNPVGTYDEKIDLTAVTRRYGPPR